MDKKKKLTNLDNNEKIKLNVLLIQFSPDTKKIKENINKVSSMLKDYNESHKIDIVVFPEMTFTGYIFDDKNDIKSCLEEKGKGQTFDFCSKLASRLKAYIFCGYPEIVREGGLLKDEKDNFELFVDDKLYNSAMIVDREGKLVTSYRKHFLYKDDKTWCIEGDEFGYLEIFSREGKIVKLGVGICMDLNPYEFTAPYEKKEFANFCKEKEVDIIIFLTNWLNGTEEDPNRFDESIERTSNLLNYWLDRCSPLLSNKISYFLAANRCGIDRDTKFAGSSGILRLSKTPALINNLTVGIEAVIYDSIELVL